MTCWQFRSHHESRFFFLIFSDKKNFADFLLNDYVHLLGRCDIIASAADAAPTNTWIKSLEDVRQGINFFFCRQIYSDGMDSYVDFLSVSRNYFEHSSCEETVNLFRWQVNLIIFKYTDASRHYVFFFCIN